MILEPTAYHHKLVNNEADLIVSERLTLSPRFPVHIGEFNNREGLSRETEPLVPLAKALDYAAALVAAERERCARIIEDTIARLWAVDLAKVRAAKRGGYNGPRLRCSHPRGRLITARGTRRACVSALQENKPATLRFNYSTRTAPLEQSFRTSQ